MRLAKNPHPGRLLRYGRRPQSAFSLVELLVVIGIIAILIALLLPTLAGAKKQANLVRCSANLSEIYKATLMYANDNRDHFPDQITTGQYTYRMQPGMLTPNEPAAEPELYGLAAVLHGLKPSDRGNVPTALRQKPRYLDGRSDVWVCPSQNDFFKTYKNTYNFSIATGVAKWTSAFRSKRTASLSFWVWDNYSARPGLSGFRGPFNTGYTIPAANRLYPHTLKNAKLGATNVLYADGHVDRDQIAAN